VDHEDRGEDRYGQKEVCQRSGDNDGRPFPHRLEMETQRAIAGIHRLQACRVGRAAGVLVAKELHIAAEWNGGDLPACAVAIIESGKLWTKADRKGQDPNAAQPGDQEMAELMKEDDQAEDEQKRDDIAGDPSPQSLDMRQKIRPHNVA